MHITLDKLIESLKNKTISQVMGAINIKIINIQHRNAQTVRCKFCILTEDPTAYHYMEYVSVEHNLNRDKFLTHAEQAEFIKLILTAIDTEYEDQIRRASVKHVTDAALNHNELPIGVKAMPLNIEDFTSSVTSIQHGRNEIDIHDISVVSQHRNDNLYNYIFTVTADYQDIRTVDITFKTITHHESHTPKTMLSVGQQFDILHEFYAAFNKAYQSENIEDHLDNIINDVTIELYCTIQSNEKDDSL